MNASVTTQTPPVAPLEADSNQRTAPVSGKVGRIAALDFTKGALILIMVLYHWLNYFVGAAGHYYIYLRFLPPSFIFISGFLVSHVYLSKYKITDSKLPRRLMTRGLKLLAVFALLNVLIDLFLGGANRKELLMEKFSPHMLWATYIVGSFADGRTVAFFVLLPISYLLILSAVLCVACRFYKHAFHVAFVGSVLLLLAISVNGMKSGNLEFLTTGLLGISIGYIPMDRIQYVLKHGFLLIIAYLGYIAAINVWGVTYPFQVVSVFLTLLLLYWLGGLSGESKRVPRCVILLGKYSLFGYIVQIAILQILHRSLRGAVLNNGVLVASFLVAVALTIAAVELMEGTRARSAVANRWYSVVFL